MSPNDLLAHDTFDEPDLNDALGRRDFAWWTVAQLRRLERHPSWLLLCLELPAWRRHLDRALRDAHRREGRTIAASRVPRRVRKRREVRYEYAERRRQKRFRDWAPLMTNVGRDAVGLAWPPGYLPAWVQSKGRRVAQQACRKGYACALREVE
jgi:hypothetical protein